MSNAPHCDGQRMLFGARCAQSEFDGVAEVSEPVVVTMPDARTDSTRELA